MITRRRLGRLFAASAVASAAFGARALAQDSNDYPPNVFISPCGKPFRAAITQPYPVGAWFAEADKDGDGKLDRDEFVADAAAFFAALDVNGDGVLEPAEINRYEHEIAPEVIGQRLIVGALGRAPRLYGGRIWLAQYGGGGTDQGEGADDSEFGRIDPHGDDADDNTRPLHDIDESGQGASPFSFFDEPEPVMAADAQLDGFIRKAAFLDLAGRHFSRLDPQGVGYLTLARLPKTKMQIEIERVQRGLRKG